MYLPSTNIINREGRMISKKISIRSPFPFIKDYAAYCSYSTLLAFKEFYDGLGCLSESD
jgi:hypothetical protein